MSYASYELHKISLKASNSSEDTVLPYNTAEYESTSPLSDENTSMDVSSLNQDNTASPASCTKSEKKPVELYIHFLMFLLNLFVSLKMFVTQQWDSLFNAKPDANYRLVSMTIYGRKDQCPEERKLNLSLKETKNLKIPWPTNEDARLVVLEYSFRGQTFKVPYNKIDKHPNIEVPVYTEQELETSMPQEFTILYPLKASEQEIIKQYAGPLNNFYQDKGLKVSLNTMPEVSSELLIITNILDEVQTFTYLQPIRI